LQDLYNKDMNLYHIYQTCKVIILFIDTEIITLQVLILLTID